MKVKSETYGSDISIQPDKREAPVTGRAPALVHVYMGMRVRDSGAQVSDPIMTGGIWE